MATLWGGYHRVSIPGLIRRQAAPSVDSVARTLRKDPKDGDVRGLKSTPLTDVLMRRPLTATTKSYFYQDGEGEGLLTAARYAWQ